MYNNHGCLTCILLQYTRRQKIIKRKIIVLDVDIKKTVLFITVTTSVKWNFVIILLSVKTIFIKIFNDYNRIFVPESKQEISFQSRRLLIICLSC
jgi:hypothetical protein